MREVLEGQGVRWGEGPLTYGRSRARSEMLAGLIRIHRYS